MAGGAGRDTRPPALPYRPFVRDASAILGGRTCIEDRRNPPGRSPPARSCCLADRAASRVRLLDTRAHYTARSRRATPLHVYAWFSSLHGPVSEVASAGNRADSARTVLTEARTVLTNPRTLLTTAQAAPRRDRTAAEGSGIVVTCPRTAVAKSEITPFTPWTRLLSCRAGPFERRTMPLNRRTHATNS